MVTFISILLILVGINAALLLFSVNGNKKTKQQNQPTIAKMYNTPIYPLNIIESKYKKAV